MRSLTRRRANYSARGGGAAEGTSRGENATKKYSYSQPRRKRRGKKWIIFLIRMIFYFDMRHLKIAKNETKQKQAVDGR